VTADELEQVWRRCAPDLLAALVRHYRDFNDAEVLCKMHYLQQRSNGRSTECRKSEGLADHGSLAALDGSVG
jgi:hypothetical protein